MKNFTPDLAHRVEQSMHAESLRMERRVARARVALALILMGPGTLGTWHLLQVSGTIAREGYWQFYLSLAFHLFFLFSALAYRRHLGSPLWRDLITIADAGLLTVASVIPLRALSHSGTGMSHTIPEFLLLVPCVLHSFRLDQGARRAVGFLASSAGAIALYIAMPIPFPPEFRLPVYPQPVVACLSYFFIFLMGTANASRLRALLAESASREIWRDRLARFLPPRAVERLEQEGGVKMAGEQHTAAVLFCDLRNFTQLTQGFAPDEVLHFLNDYFEKLVKVIFEHGGTVDKFLGDGVLAVFTDPIAEKMRADAALHCALAMRNSLETFNEERASKSRAALTIGIGIHYGPVIAGWLGSEQRPEYTVLGKTVNIASRLEGMTKRLGREIILSADAHAALSEAPARQSMGTHSIRGIAEAMELFTPIVLSKEQAA